MMEKLKRQKFQHLHKRICAVSLSLDIKLLKKNDGKCDVTICSFLIKLLLYGTFLMIIQYIQVPPCRAQPKILGGMILATFIQQ